MEDHISIKGLLRYIKRPLGSKEDEDDEIHLAQCDKCVNNLVRIDKFIILLGEEIKKGQKLK